MANTIKTQCPSCQSVYPIPNEQLANNEAKARCPNCQTVFFINHNRYLDRSDTPAISTRNPSVTADTEQSHAPTIEPLSDSSLNLEKESFDQPSLDTVATDFSQDDASHQTNHEDRMDTPDSSNLESDNANLSLTDHQHNEDNQKRIIDSVDDMSEWLEQQTNAIHQEKQDKASIDNIKTDRHAHSLAGQSPARQRANKANKNDNEGAEWETPLESSRSIAKNNNAEDLSDLLTSYGVAAEKKEIKKESNQLEKMRDRVLSNGPTSQQIASKQSPVTSILWLCGCVLLVALLLVQYTIFNINSLVKNPNHRGKLVTACNILSCRLPGTDLDALRITHVKHRLSQVGSTTNASKMDIMAAIINQSTDAQLYPNLKVSIQGANGTIAEFVAPPEDYLTVNQEQISGNQAKLFMFTVNIDHNQVDTVDIQPFY